MAENSSEKSGGKTLDNLSKEDLIKFSKKQAINVSQMKTKINDLIKKNEKFESENASLRETSARCKDENECLVQKLNTMTDSYQLVMKELDERNEELVKIKPQLEEKQKQQQPPADENFLRVAMENLEKEKAKLEMQMASDGDSLRILQEENEKLKAQIKKEINECDSIEYLRAELKSKEAEVLLLKQTLDQLEETKVEFQNGTSELQSSLEVCEQKLKEFQRENAELKRVSDEDRLKQETELQELSLKLDEVSKEKDGIEEREQKLKAMAQKMKVELLRRREEEKNRLEVSDRTEDTVNELNEKIIQLEKEISVMKEELEKDQEKEDKKNEKIDRLTNEMIEQHKISKASIDQHVNECAKLQIVIKEKEVAVTELSETIDRKNLQLQEHLDEIAALKTEIYNIGLKEKTKPTDNYSNDLDDEKKSNVNDEISTLEKEVLSLKSELQEEYEKQKRKDDEIANMSEELIEQENSFKATISEQVESCYLLKSEIKEKNLAEADLIKANENQKEELTNLYNKIAELESQIDEMKEIKDLSESQVIKNEKTETKLNEMKELVRRKDVEIENLRKELSGEVINLKEAHNDLERIKKDLHLKDSDLNELQNEASSLKDEMHRLEEAAAKNETDVKNYCQTIEELKDLVVKVEDENSSLQSKLVDLESSLHQLATKNEELVKNAAESEEERKANSVKLASLTKALEDEKTRHKATYAKLENFKKNAQKKSVMHLEISDYEKTVDQLNRKIEQKDKEKQELVEEIEACNEKISALTNQNWNLETQKEEEANRADLIKASLDKVRLDLEKVRETDHIKQMREVENEERVESLKREVETLKIQMVEATTLAKRGSDELAARLESEQRSFKTLQSRYELAEDELQSSHLEITALKEEMLNYKSKAQAVLKQAKAESLSKEMSKAQKLEMERMEERIRESKLEIDSLQNEIRETIDEADAVKGQHEALQRANADLQRQFAAAEERHRLALKELELESVKSKNNYERSIAQLSEQQTKLAESHRVKIENMTEQHRVEKRAIQRAADSNEQEVFRLQKELHIALAVGSDPNTNQSANHGVFGSNLVTEGDALLRGAAFISSIERQEGEGMEHTDTSECNSPTPSQLGHSSFVPFDQLLNSPTFSTVEPTSSSKKPIWPTEEVTLKTLHDELSTCTKKVQHLTELLRESEATNARLTEESKFLKEEIRRSERNSDRRSELSNTEYLKNVIFKFLALDADTEQRLQLVPVLTTLLKLSPEERNILSSVASGESPSAASSTQANAAEGGGWSAYLHRWSGLI